MSYVASAAQQKPGERYRLVANLRAPYTIENIERLEEEWRRRSISAHIRVTQFLVHFPNKFGVWSVEIRYEVLPFDVAGPFKLLLDDIGRLCQNVVASVIGPLVMTALTVQKEVVAAVAGAGDALGHLPVFNPGFVVLAVVGIFLITRRG